MIEIKIPSPGESITEVTLIKWFVNDNQLVIKNQELAEIESDKATLTLTAPEDGIIHLVVMQGQTAKVGTIACTIDVKIAGSESIHPNVSQPSINKDQVEVNDEDKVLKITPLARKLMEEHSLTEEIIKEKRQRITTTDIKQLIESQNFNPMHQKPDRSEQRQTISSLRKKLSQRLVQVKNQTAMLTTFNEVDMSKIMEIRNNYKAEFEKQHQIKLGFMSFFAKASSIALSAFPNINSMLDGDDIVKFNYTDIGIAVQTTKGLMVPIIRDVQDKGITQIELEIAHIAQKARDAKISLDELSGGTFSITNGGVYGSMFSTPIINPPQAAILGMHAIQDRPVVRDGQIVIRPMMYLALSYDHRIVDGKDSVSFLVKIKEMIEKPEQLLTNGREIGDFLLF